MGTKLTPEDFLVTFAPTISKVCGMSGIPASVCIAQAILESGWGESTIGQFNLFGRKYGGTGGVVEVATQEFEAGGYTNKVCRFQDYTSLSDAIADYCVLILEDEKYVSVATLLQTGCTLEEYVVELAGIYATAEQDDGIYSKTIITLISENELRQYDNCNTLNTETAPMSNVGSAEPETV